MSSAFSPLNLKHVAPTVASKRGTVPAETLEAEADTSPLEALALAGGPAFISALEECLNELSR